MKKAILFGASGFVGGYLLRDLLQSDIYSEVTIVVRKPLNLQHPKLNIVIADYHSLAQNAAYLVGDDVFISLGTTKKKTPNQKEYYQIYIIYIVDYLNFQNFQYHYNNYMFDIEKNQKYHLIQLYYHFDN